MSDRLRPVRAICKAAAELALVCVLSGPAVAAEQGLAGWYGKLFHGRPTANGEVFDAGALTAAHRTLPFGSSVRVRRLDNGQAVVVRINDRGPVNRARIIDLSEGAARRLAMMESGVVRVSLEVLDARGAPGFAVAPAVFRGRDSDGRTGIGLSLIRGTGRPKWDYWRAYWQGLL